MELAMLCQMIYTCQASMAKGYSHPTILNKKEGKKVASLCSAHLIVQNFVPAAEFKVNCTCPLCIS